MRRSCIFIVMAGLVLVGSEGAAAQTGACNADLVGLGPTCGPDGVVDNSDHFFLQDCAANQSNPCGPLSDCDVNCDGVVDALDAEVPLCAFANPQNPEVCCALCVGGPVPRGPCTADQVGPGPTCGSDGVVDNNDILFLGNCAANQFNPCGPLSNCDTNCDGQVTSADADVAGCVFANPGDPESCCVSCDTNPCESDLVGLGPTCGPDGVVDNSDHLFIQDCVANQSNPCGALSDCDVNCDGVVDAVDAEVPLCIFSHPGNPTLCCAICSGGDVPRGGCDADVANSTGGCGPDGAVDNNDQFFLQNCAATQFNPCGLLSDCDVNCDGVVNGADADIALCVFANPGDPDSCCVICAGGEIPTMSEWGLMSLAAILAALGAIVVRKRRRDVVSP